MKTLRWILLALFMCGCATRGFPPREQIVNFDRVNADLYRGGQPNAAAIQWLRGIGVKSIINLRMANDCWSEEAAVAAQNGIVYTNMPLRGFTAPTMQEMGAIAAALRTLPKPIFLHCQHGCDRTGTVIACYHIAVDSWDSARALAEAKFYGMSTFEVGMKHFVEMYRWR
jgi:protein tyrosine/serine phosphatase